MTAARTAAHLAHGELTGRILGCFYDVASTLGHGFSEAVLCRALAIALAWKGYGYWALVWREFARCALLTLGMWAAFPWIPGPPRRKTNVWGLVTFGADLIPRVLEIRIDGNAKALHDNALRSQ